jgi:pimeloyl-ACP methyl ester carboxylesterase
MKPGDGSIAWELARSKILGQKCLAALGGSGSESPGGSVQDWGAGRFMTSTSVATDMLRMTQLLGREKLQYWGISYGTALGQYFASLYPDKIGRVVIDGILDADRYRSATSADVTPDIEKVFDTFFTTCSKAGPQKCPLYSPDPSVIRNRVFGILDKVVQDPVPIPFADNGPLLLSEGILRMRMFRANYQPIGLFESLAADLVAIENNNQPYLATLGDQYAVQCNCGNSTGPPAPPPPRGPEAVFAISCTDGDPFVESKDDVKKFLEDKSKISPHFAFWWAWLRSGCNNWPIRPKQRYTGLFTLPSNISLSTNTSSSEPTSPILLISTRLDPVCPLSSAQKVQARLGSKNSRLVIQESAGHTSFSTPSVCTANWVKGYFNEGKVPGVGEQINCEVNDYPFIGTVQENADVKPVDQGDAELESAVRRLSKAWLL